MHKFKVKDSDILYNIKNLINSNVSDYSKINSIYERLFLFNENFKTIYFNFSCKEYERFSNIRIKRSKMHMIDKLKFLFNMSYDVLLSIYQNYQKSNPVSQNLPKVVKKIKLFIDYPNEINYKEILKFIINIDLNFSEYINNLSNNSESYHKIIQFISALDGLLEIIKNLVEREKINYNCFSGFIKSFCASDQEKIPEQLNICCKHLNKNYHEYLY